MAQRYSRREFLKWAGIGAGGALLAACQPQIVEKTVEVPVKETAIVAEQVETTVVVKETVEVEVAKEIPPEPVLLRWWDFPRGWAPPGSAEEPNAWNEGLAEQYMAENPNITMEFTGVSWSDGPQKLDVALAAGDPPNVMYGYPALFGKMLSVGALAPIDSYLATVDEADLADFFEPAWDFATVEGKRYAWPWYYGSEGEWAINMTIAQEAGADDLAPQPPEYGWTPEEFLALAQKCTFDRDGTQVWGAYMYSNEMQGINLWPLWSFAYMFGANLYDEMSETCTFGGDEGVTAFQYMYDLVEKHKVAPPGAAGLTGGDGFELWSRKELATRTSGGVEQVIGIETAIEEGTIEGPFEVLPVLPPALEGLPVRTNGGIGVQMVFKPDDPLVLNEAIKFGQYLTNPDQLAIIGNLTPLCARKSVTEELGAGDPVTQWRIEHVLPTMASYSKHPQDFKIDDAWMQALQAMFGGEKAPEEAAGWFQDEANRLLQEE